MIFKIVGNIPFDNERLNRSASWYDISLFKSFRILFGMLFGPTALLSFRDNIISDTSVLSVGVIKNEFMLIWGR